MINLLKKIFGKSEDIRWFRVFDTIDEAIKSVPLNKVVKVALNEEEVCLTRTAKGFFAIKNECPHQKRPLDGGTCNEENEIVCPYHRHRFDLKSGDDRTNDVAASLKTFPMKVNKSGVFVGKK